MRALIESRYTVESERSGEIVARYVSSENLEYGTSQGPPVIHRGYNTRVQRLSKVIGTEIAIARVSDDPPAVAV